MFQTSLAEMFKAEYLCIYINIRCICKNKTVSHSKFSQQLLGLTLRVNPCL